MAGRAAPIHIRVNGPGGWYQTFGLTEREAEHGAQGQRRGDRKDGVVRLPPGVVRRSAPQAAIAASV